MFNWFDLMRQAQTSAGMETLAQQYNLSGEQAQKAMAAFLPAFAMGLQQAATRSDPASLLQTMTADAYRNFWQIAGQTFSSQAQREGRRLLDQLFGSDETSRRIAHQAADYTGLGIDVMQQMLPIMAGIFAGGMYQMATAQAKALQALAPSESSSRRRQVADPWAELWAAWLGTGQAEARTARNPFEDYMASFIPKATEQRKEPQDAAPAPAPWESMMDVGREMQEQYLASLQAIFQDTRKPEKAKD